MSKQEQSCLCAINSKDPIETGLMWIEDQHFANEQECPTLIIMDTEFEMYHEHLDENVIATFTDLKRLHPTLLSPPMRSVLRSVRAEAKPPVAAE
jgi:hypothetical protein